MTDRTYLQALEEKIKQQQATIDRIMQELKFRERLLEEARKEYTRPRPWALPWRNNVVC